MMFKKSVAEIGLLRKAIRQWALLRIRIWCGLMLRQSVELISDYLRIVASSVAKRLEE